MTKPQTLLTIGALAAAIAGLPLAAQAQVYKCRQADGNTSYQATPCPNSRPPAPAPAPTAPSPAPSREPYYDPYAPANASKRATLVPPPQPQAPMERAPRAASPAPAQVTRPADVQRAQATESLRREVEQVQAQQRAQNCAAARQQVGVNKEQRPIYHYDKDGNREYVADADRARTLANAQQRVAQECN